MEDQKVHAHIEELVAEEHRLLEHGDRRNLSADDRKRLEHVEVQLDQCWDLLRQRRARREAGQDPDTAHVRPAGIVENYEQ